MITKEFLAREIGGYVVESDLLVLGLHLVDFASKSINNFKSFKHSVCNNYGFIRAGSMLQARAGVPPSHSPHVHIERQVPRRLEVAHDMGRGAQTDIAQRNLNYYLHQQGWKDICLVQAARED